MGPPPPCKVMTRTCAAVTVAGFTLAEFDHTITYLPFSEPRAGVSQKLCLKYVRDQRRRHRPTVPLS